MIDPLELEVVPAWRGLGRDDVAALEQELGGAGVSVVDRENVTFS